MKKIVSFLIISAVFAPLFAFAAAEGIKSYLNDIHVIINQLLLLSVAAALLVFFWGLVKFIGKAGDQKSHEAGRSLMVWGTIALFIMATIGGILYYIGQDLNIKADTPIPVTTFSG